MVGKLMRPYELLARFKSDGTVGGIHVRYVETVGGRDFELDPIPLADINDPVFGDFASAFNASIVAERDQLAINAASAPSLQSRIAELEAELDALKKPPLNARRLAPFEFLSRFQASEVVAWQTSSDPMVCIGRAKLQTIITYVDLDLPETIGLVQYLESIGIIGAGRAAEVLSSNG